MSKKRAFVRYTKSGEIVPGSLIITTNGGYPDKSSLWQEVTVDQCCDGETSCLYTSQPIPFFEGLYNGEYANPDLQGFNQRINVANPFPSDSPTLVGFYCECEDRGSSINTGNYFNLQIGITPTSFPLDNTGLYTVTLPLILSSINNYNYPNVSFNFTFEQTIIPSLELYDNGFQLVTITDVPAVIIKINSSFFCQTCQNVGLGLYIDNPPPALPNPNN